MYPVFAFCWSALFIGAAVLAPTSWALRRNWSDVQALGLGLIVPAVAAWIVVFAYLADPAFGVALRWLVLILIVIWASTEIRKRMIAGPSLVSPLVPLAAPALASFFFGGVLLIWAFAVGAEGDVLAAAATRFSHDLPTDNQLPLMFAEYARAGAIPSPMSGDWLGSDRPPLQSGFHLLFGAPAGDAEVRWAYQIVSTLAQTWAALGAFVLALALFGSRRASWLAGAAVALCPLFIIHGVYVWPKLLPAGLLCVTASLFFTPQFTQSRHTIRAALLAGVAAGLAMGAHGATAFTLLGFSLVAVLLHRFPSPRFIFAGVGAFAACYAPWRFYQVFVDPPGDRLLKWHLANTPQVTDQGLVSALRQSLSEVSALDYIYGRWVNVSQLIRNPLDHLMLKLDILSATDPAGLVNHVRALDFFVWSYGLGVFAPFLWLSPLALLSPRTRSLFLATAAALVIWAVLIFEPGQAITHQGSYFPQMAAMALIVGAIGRHAWPVAAILLVLQTGFSLLVYLHVT